MKAKFITRIFTDYRRDRATATFHRNLMDSLTLAANQAPEFPAQVAVSLDCIMAAYRLRQASVFLCERSEALASYIVKSFDPPTRSYVKGRGTDRGLVSETLMRRAIAERSTVFAGESAQAFASIPMLFEGEVIGVMNLVWHPGVATQKFDPLFLESLADRVVALITTNRLLPLEPLKKIA